MMERDSVGKAAQSMPRTCGASSGTGSEVTKTASVAFEGGAASDIVGVSLIGLLLVWGVCAHRKQDHSQIACTKIRLRSRYFDYLADEIIYDDWLIAWA